MNYQDIKVGQRLTLVQESYDSIPGKKIGDIVTVSALGGSFLGDTWVYVEGFKADSGMGCPAAYFEPAPPILDLSKPLECVDGTPFTLVTAEGRDPKCPIIGYVGDQKTLRSFNKDGVYYYADGSKSVYDLRNVKPKPREVVRYFNIYDGDEGSALVSAQHNSKASAERDKSPSLKLIGVKRVVFTEGEWDE